MDNNYSFKQGFSTVMTASLYEVIGQDSYGNDLKDFVDYDFEFDYLEDTNVGSSINVTSQPTVDGDYIADHIYREPKTVNLSGSFSLNGNMKTRYGINRLRDIETLFERIQSEGAMCKIVKRNNSAKNDERFKVRNNLVLNSINWTESLNTLSFNFGFTEVMKSNSVEIEYHQDVTDTDLPSMSAPQAQAFSESSLFDSSEIVKSLLNYLMSAEAKLVKAKNWKAGGYKSSPQVTDIFIDFIQPVIDKESQYSFNNGWEKGLAIAGVALAAVSLVAIKVLSTIIAAGACTGPVGWIVAAVAAGAAALAGLAFAIKGWIAKSKYSIKTFKFKYFEDKEKQDSKNSKEVDRFLSLIGSVTSSFEEYNKYITVYNLTVNEPQYFRASFDNVLLKFEFERSNADEDGVWTLKLYENDSESPFMTVPDISQEAKTSMAQASSEKDLLGQHRVYIINQKMLEDMNARYDLSTYSIMISSLELSNWQDNIDKVIKAYCESRNAD